MKSPIFFSKGRTVRFWIQIVLVLALVRIAVVPSALYANPTGEQVVGGAAGFNRPDAATLIVNQNTDRAVINWNSFSIANGELTRFVQPSSSSAVLNRVVTANPSAVYGTLQANGNVYLINPGGVLVGAGGVVNTASFVASTQDINTEEFMKGGQLNFKGNSDASVINEGNITAREGDVFLIAKEVRNEGQLMAKDGTVGMVSGTEVSLQAVGQGNFKVRLMAAETDPTSPRTSQSEGGASKGSAEIVNEGVIQAANAVLEAKGSYLPMAIKNTGVIEATGLVENGDGSVTLTGGEGDILNTGVVAALQRSLDGQRESGGAIMMTAKNVTSDLGSVITASGKDGGGSVKLRSADTTILRGSIEVVGEAESAKGGKVQLLGERVGLFDQAKVDASGGAGGGEVLVGGDYQGKNVDVKNAFKTFVGEEVGLFADSKSGGNGGKVIVWADEWTKFYGGAQVNGYLDGGFIEISGKEILDFSGTVSAKGWTGIFGSVLFDPTTLAIVAGSGVTGGVSGNAVPPAPLNTSTLFSDSGVAGTLGNLTLNQALISANVVVLASDGMEVNAPVIVPAGIILTLSGVTLDMNAGISGQGTLDLNFAGTVNQTAIVSTSNLVLRSTTVNFGTLLNGVSDLAATTGTISFANSSGINISALAYQGGAANGIESATSVTLLAGGDITQSAPIGDSSAAVPKSVGTLRAGTFGGGNIFLDSDINDVNNLSLRTEGGTPIAPSGTATAAFLRFDDVDGFVIQNWTLGGLSGGILTAKGGNTLLPTGGSVILGAGQGPDNDPPVTQAAGARINASNLGLLGKADYTLTETSNDIYTIAAYLTNAGDLSYTDANGFQVFYLNFDPADTTYDVFIPGIRLEGRAGNRNRYVPGSLTLQTVDGSEYDGIQLTATGRVGSPLGIVTISSTIDSTNQYDLLTTFAGEQSAPGHIEASGDVTISVGNNLGIDQANRFTLQEGIHLFAGLNVDLTSFGSAGSATIQADNMTIGSFTDSQLTMHGIIMTGNVNEADEIRYVSSTALLPFTAQRQAFIVTPKADYNITPDPGELQLSQAELRRINTSRLQIDSGYTSETDFAVDVRTPLNLYGLYDTVEVTGTIFPTNPGVNRLELIAFGGDAGGGARGNVQVSGDISSDVNRLPMDIFLSASAADQTSGGFVNVNAGLRSYGGQIALQGQNVNINAAVNANNPDRADGLGLVAIFPGQGPTAANPGTGVTPISLGTKVDESTLGILRTELALITAGTVQIGELENRPRVLQPVNPFTRSSITGTDPLWKNFILQANDAGPITVTDLISNLSFNTLALVTSGDPANPTNYALSQTSQAGIQVAGLFVVGNPLFPTSDYVLAGAFNEIDHLAVALGLATATGAPSGDFLLVNQKGLVGGNGGEVARIQQQWDQNYTRTTTDPFLSTGVGLVVARGLSITASGSVSIYETVPTGVTGLGYIGHVASNPNALDNGSSGYAQVGNEIGLVGDPTSGLAINVIQSAAGTTGVNDVWAAAARGLSINDLTGQFGATAAEAGILTNGGQVTLEGNAIEIASTVSRVATSAGDFSANTITIDTTGALTTAGASVVAPSGARVVIRPATGQNGFQNSAGSGAFDPNLENSSLAGAPIEMNLGTTSAQAGVSVPGFTPTFLNASLGTIFMGSSTMEGGAIRGNVLEIGRNGDPGTASGKISITDDIGSAGNLMSTLVETLHLISGGPVEDSGMMVTGGTPNTITMNLNGVLGSGGLAVDSQGAIAIQADVSLLAIDAGANNNVRFIETAGGVSIGVMDGVSGILANTFYLDVTGGIAQASGATIQATGGGVSLQSTGSIRLDQENDFNLVAAFANNGAANQPIYLRTSGPMSVSIFGSGQPGGQPGGVTGITGSNVTLVAGGDLQQSNLAQITASGSFLATVLDGADVLLNSTLNTLGARPVIAALKADGTLGNVANLTIVNNGAVVLGSAGVLTADLASAGSGWTLAPTVTVSGTSTSVASVSTVMGLNSIAVGSGGSGYQSAPLVTLTDGGGTGVGAIAVAIVDSNPLSSTYGQVTSINITNPGTGYTGTVTASLSGGGATQGATAGTVTLAIQRLNVSDPGSGYTSTPQITFTGGGAGSGATAAALIGGTGGYVASGSTTVLGGITGDLDITTAAGGITNGSGLSVAGTTTLKDSSGVGIILGSQNNNFQGVLTITENGTGPVTVANNNGLILGDITVGAGDLTMTALINGITQSASGNSILTGGNASFYAVNTSGIANGPVILNNSLNSFSGAVAATGTRVVIRDNTALNLGAVTASTSLSATSTGNFTQSGAINVTGTGASAINASGTVTLTLNSSFGGDLSVISTDAGPATTINQTGGVLTVAGNSTFTAAGGNSISVGQANTFSGTVSFAASSGNLANITVQDTTALVLGGLTLGAGGDLSVTAPGITQSGAFVVPGTITLAGGTANNITLNNAANNFGTVVISSAYNASITDLNSIILGPGTVSGALTLNSGISSQSGPITVVGTTTVTAGLNAINLSNSGNDFGTSVNLINSGLNNISVQDVGALVIGNISMSSLLGGGLTIQAGGDITQLTGTTITTGTGLIAITGVNASSITLANAENAFNGTVVTLAPSVGVGNRLQNVTLLDTTTFDVQSGLNLSGNFVLTAAGVTQSGAITVVGSTTVSAGANAIDLSNSGNDFGTSVNLSNTGANNISVRDTGALVIGNISMSSGLGGGLTIQAGGDITQLTGATITTGIGAIDITGVDGSSVTLANTGNSFNGAVTLAPSGAGVNRLQDISLTSTSAFEIQNGLALNGNLNLTAAGITQAGATTVGGTTTLNGGTGAIVLTNSGNSYGGTVTVTGGASADMFFSLADEGDLGPVTTSEAFTLRTGPTISFNIANGASAGFDVTTAQLSNFNVGTFAPIATGGGDLDLGNLMSYAGIGGISLTTVGGGDINALGVIKLNTLQLSSSGGATFSEVNEIQNLGNVTVAVGGVTLQNSRGLNLTGTVSMPQRFSLEVAGQFYNQTGQSQPLAGVAGGSVIKSLSLMGGLPNQIPGLAGFSNRYDGVMPTSGNVMSYAVSPLAMFAPSGTTIAGVDLGGTQTGGGQFNTFLTGSDNLNWMISDFGRFEMPTVKPSGMDYILYPQRVEPETRTLPAATLGQLEQELGRPPTLDEIQAREVAVREAAMVRSGAILERTSFDAVEDETDKQDSADVPAQVIDGGKPQAGGPSFAPSPASAGGASEGFGPQARKTQSVKQGSNGPILRSGPIRSVAELRDPEPAEGASAGKTATQAVHLDAKSVIEQERASAEVGVAPPIAAGR
jgi:filamentous hemagglutinin family protein